MFYKIKFLLILMSVTVFISAETATLNCGVVRYKVWAQDLDSSLTIVQNSVRKLKNEHSDVDVILLPEYSGIHKSFYRGAVEYKYGLKLEESTQGITIASNQGVVDSSTLRFALGIQALALEQNIPIIFSTLMTQLEVDQNIYPNLPDTVLCNTTLFINKNGEIYDYDYKVTGSDWMTAVEWGGDPYYGYVPSGIINDEAIQLTNTTTKKRIFTNHDGFDFITGNVICAERSSSDMWSTYGQDTLDIIFYSELEGDHRYEDHGKTIQDGFSLSQADSASFYDDKWLMGNMLNYSTQLPQTYFVIAEGSAGMGTAFNTTFDRPLDVYEYASDSSYFYTEIPKTVDAVANYKKQSLSLRSSVKISGSKLTIDNSLTGPVNISILSPAGRVVMEKSSNERTIDLDRLTENLAEGVLILKIKVGKISRSLLYTKF